MNRASAFPFSEPWDAPAAVQLALLLEASAPKAGNVHPTAAFTDMTFTHFAASAVAVRQAFQESESKPSASVGAWILRAASAVKEAVARNTILGSLLLFGPVVKSLSSASGCSRDGLRLVLTKLTAEDSRAVYQAIRLAQPGGLGHRAADDVTGEAPGSLIEAMSQVAAFDAVARQYTNAFEDIFERTVPWLDEELQHASDVLDAICRLQLRWLAHEPDGLIVRKLGMDRAREVQAAAQATWNECRDSPNRCIDLQAYHRFDSLLRTNGHRLNPGTTADLIAATLLVKLVGG